MGLSLLLPKTALLPGPTCSLLSSSLVFSLYLLLTDSREVLSPVLLLPLHPFSHTYTHAHTTHDIHAKHTHLRIPHNHYTHAHAVTTYTPTQTARLTKTQWASVRAFIGRPRRLSARFLASERAKLDRYRDTVRAVQQRVMPGLFAAPQGIPAQLACSDRVTALLPDSDDVCPHLGTVVSVHDSQYLVRFDESELGMRLVPDTHVMPHAPVHALAPMRGHEVAGERVTERVRFPERERAILSANGFTFPSLSENACDLEISRPGFQPLSFFCFLACITLLFAVFWAGVPVHRVHPFWFLSPVQ